MILSSVSQNEKDNISKKVDFYRLIRQINDRFIRDKELLYGFKFSENNVNQENLENTALKSLNLKDDDTNLNKHNEEEDNNKLAIIENKSHVIN